MNANHNKPDGHDLWFLIGMLALVAIGVLLWYIPGKPLYDAHQKSKTFESQQSNRTPESPLKEAGQ